MISHHRSVSYKKDKHDIHLSLALALNMAPSRTARIYFLLVLDSLFFLLEIVIGKSLFVILSPSILINPLPRLCCWLPRPRRR